MSQHRTLSSPRTFPRLLEPLPSELVYQRTARPVPCSSEDQELWFSEFPADLERAKAHCRACPVKAACLAGALSRAEPWGVWGGEIFKDGQVIAQKRARGRPRKNIEAA